MNDEIKVLLLEDDKGLSRVIALFLKEATVACDVIHSVPENVEGLGKYTHALLDRSPPGSLEFIRELKKKYPGMSLIAFTGDDSPEAELWKKECHKECAKNGGINPILAALDIQ